ncbi:MAG TPA: VOC family protein [Streptosporangiaceae bacterium]
MELVQCRIVTDDVGPMAAFYAGLVGVDVPLNDYYVEIQAGAASVGFSRRGFTGFRADETARSVEPAWASGRGVESAWASGRGQVVLDFLTGDADAQYPRIDAMGVEWLMPPKTQPWGSRSMIFRDPEGHLVNVFSR